MTTNRIIKLADVKDAPWRFSEDRTLQHPPKKYYAPILENIIRSLETDGQFAPIHVRRLYQHGADPNTVVYEIVDGHIVVQAARQLGLTEMEAIVHQLTDEQARERYIHFNLNRCGMYGHYHVKIHREFQKVAGDSTEAKAALVHKHCAWPIGKITDYIGLGERDETWKRFMYVPRSEENESVNEGGQQEFIGDLE